MGIGKLAEFNVRAGNWTLYVERVEMYFKVNAIKEDLWLPTLIAAMGDEAYELLSNLTSPKKPSEKTFITVVQVMRDHLQPKPSFMAERYRFRQRRQLAGESISQYISELKRLSRYCEFETVLEENLRDQLVCGLSSELIRQRVFTEENLGYAKAVKIACAMEAAERDAAAVERTGGGETASSSGSADVLHAGVARRGRPAGGRGGTRLPSRAGQYSGGGKNTCSCSVCGAGDHRSDDCRYKTFICGKCRQRGHLRRVCPARGGVRAQRTTGADGLVAHVQAGGGSGCGGAGSETGAALSGDDEPPHSEDDWEVEEDLHQLCLNGYKPVRLSVLIDGIEISMEVDTGSLVSCISRVTYDRYFRNRVLQRSDLVFKFYNGDRIQPLGVIKPGVTYGRECKSLELFVIEGGTTSLLGRQWLSELKIRIPALYKSEMEYVLKSNTELSTLLSRYNELFTEGLGRFRGGKAKLRVREGATPVFCRARQVPYALQDRVDEELDAMLRAGVVEPVESADWATPLVPVRKADGGLRICADYKVTLNPVLLIDRYPLPRIDDLLVKLNGAKVLSKIDLSQAYNQIELDDPHNLTVINTHRGLLKYKRLVFGLSSSPGIFQRIMSNLLNDIPNVQVFLDDIIIGTTTMSQHLEVLERVLDRLCSNGMKLKRSKCFFMTDEVKYLGYIISAQGIQADPEKIEGIVNIPTPSNVTELRSLLGTINFYAKFVKNLSTILAPLYNLLKKACVWKWDRECEVAFKKVKSILTSMEVLAHYNPDKPLFLTCDASARGIGGVLTQLSGSGPGARERPVVYVSRALTGAETHYSQIEREALAIVFSLERLHQYLYGRRFTLRTDHKPLVTIFGPKQGIPSMAASRLQRWAIKLTAYTYDIEFVGTKDNGADGLSRLPAVLRSYCKQDDKIPDQTFLHFAQNAMLMDYNEIKKQTSRDRLLGRILNYVREEWPSNSEIVTLKPYFNRKNELYEELGCIMWGHRVVVPEACRSKVLAQLHEAHMGMVKTKSFARSYVWWPGMDEAIESLCRACSTCAAEADAPPRHAPCPWPWPDKPWARVHLDFLGPLNGRIYLIMVDARTKWIEVSQVPSTAANHTISRLTDVFARFGLPRQIVSDNGPPFTSSEFSQFLRSNGVEHLFSAPYHPASNGAAENAVKTIKKVIKKAMREHLDVTLSINNFLLYYRNTEHCTTGETPALLMCGRRLRTKLDALKPDITANVRNAQAKQKLSGTQGQRELRPGEEVWLRQHRGVDRWVPGKVAEKLGTTDYRVVDTLGKEVHKHVDQLKRRMRSSLIYSPSNLPSNPETSDMAVVGGKSSPRHSTASSCEVISTRSKDEVQDQDDPFLDCEEPVGQPDPIRSPSLPAPESTQTRPKRLCRLNKEPNYKC